VTYRIKGPMMLTVEHADSDRFTGVHLPLHIKLQASLSSPNQREGPMPNDDSDADSECTNPHLQGLMDRYFPEEAPPSEDYQEDAEFDADGESEAIEKRPRRVARTKSRRRQRSKKVLGFAQDVDILNGDVVLPLPLPQAQSPQMNTPRFSRKVSDGGEAIAEPPVRTVVPRFNAWDSSPSTVGDTDQDVNVSFDNYFNAIEYEEAERQSLDVRKNLFSDDEDSIHFNSGSELNDALLNDVDVTDDSDLDLAQQSRQIQYDLRLKEMKELAVEAERAAEAGKEKFVGNATKFELGLGLDVGNSSQMESPNRSISDHRVWSVWGKLECQGPDYDAVTPLRGYKKGRSQDLGLLARTEVKRPRALASKSRQSSAPSKMQSKKMSASSLPGILSSATFLSVAPPNDVNETIPVLALRHISEVIPAFKEMHPFMKAHMFRVGVKNENIGIRLDEMFTQEADKTSKDEKSHCRDSLSFLPRVPSFHTIIKSMSGLSGSEKVNAESGAEKVTTGKSDDDISNGDKSEEENDEDLSLGPHDMALGCVSFVSCGDGSEDIAVCKRLNSSFCVDDEISVIISKGPRDIYACTLATELHDPRLQRRSVSPPPLAPYSNCMDSDEDLEITPRRALRTTRTRWSTFWDNLAPAKKNLEIQSPLRLARPYLSRGSWAHFPDELAKPTNGLFRSSSDFSPTIMNFESPFRDRSTSDFVPTTMQVEAPFYLQPPTINSSVDEPWELQKDAISNGIIISSQSFSQIVPRSGSYESFEHANCEDERVGDGDLEDDSSSRPNACQVTIEEANPAGADETLFCGKDYSKSSFRTTTTQSGGDSQSSEFSKFSDSSQRSQCHPSDSLALTIISADENMANTASVHSLVSTITSVDQNTSFPFSLIDREQDSNSVKPPLHPAGGGVRLDNALLNNVGNRKPTLLMRAEKEILATIDGSISYPDYSEASSDLSYHSENELELSMNVLDAQSNSKLLDYNGDDLKKESSSKSSMFDLWLKTDNDGEANFCAAAPTVSNKEETPQDDLEVSFEFTDEESVVSVQDENNKSMSFMNLMEKVPSVIGRFRPFRKRNKAESSYAYRDETAFVENYLFTGISPANYKGNIQVVEDVTNQGNQFCGKGPCINIGCVSVLSALTCLSVHPPRDHHDETSKPYSPPGNSEKYGKLNNSGRYEKLIVGNRFFRSPSLRVSKRGGLIDESLNRSFDSATSVAGVSNVRV